MTTDGNAFLELARSAEHLTELRDAVDDLLGKEWSAERSRDLLEADGPTWAVELWEQLYGLGWAELLVDGTVADFCVVAEAVGTSTAPVPLVTTAVANWAGAATGDDHAMTVAVAGAFTATIAGDGNVVLSGDQTLVPYADVAERLLVRARVDAQADVIVTLDTNSEHVALESLRPLDGMPCAWVEFRSAHVSADDIVASGPGASALAHEIELRLTLGWTAELTGVAAAANAIAVDYARERIAFDRPIGTFQAIKHRLVDQRAAVEVSRALIGRAAQALDANAPDRAALVALAAFWAGDSLRAVPEGAIQVFGGIGYTWEHVAHVYLRRAAVLVALVGSRATHRDVAAEWLRRR